MEKYRAYARHMLNSGIFLQPGRPTRAYIYGAHNDRDIQHTIDATTSFLENHKMSLR